MTDALVKGLRQNALWVTTHEAADRIEALEREVILDAKLLADTQALLDKAVVALRDVLRNIDKAGEGVILIVDLLNAAAVLTEIEGHEQR